MVESSTHSYRGLRSSQLNYSAHRLVIGSGDGGCALGPSDCGVYVTVVLHPGELPLSVYSSFLVAL